jgi:hypothetical protein
LQRQIFGRRLGQGSVAAPSRRVGRHAIVIT